MHYLQVFGYSGNLVAHTMYWDCSLDGLASFSQHHGSSQVLEIPVYNVSNYLHQLWCLLEILIQLVQVQSCGNVFKPLFRYFMTQLAYTCQPTQHSLFIDLASEFLVYYIRNDSTSLQSVRSLRNYKNITLLFWLSHLFHQNNNNNKGIEKTYIFSDA